MAAVCYLTAAILGLAAWLYGRKKDKWKKYTRYMQIAVVTAAAAGTAALWEFCVSKEMQRETCVERNEAGAGDNEVTVQLDVDGILEKYPVTVLARERRLAPDEVRQKFRRAQEELEKKILGENQSLDCITDDLYLPDSLQEGLVQAEYMFDNYDVIDSSGTVLWENFKDDKYLVKVTANLTCQGEAAVHEFYVQITSEELSEKEKLLLGLSKAIQTENEKTGTDKLTLPVTVNGKTLNWQKEKEELHFQILAAGIAAAVLLYLRERRKKEQIMKQRESGLILDYPEIVSQLSLLTGAGMTVGAAWARIAGDYETRMQQGTVRRKPGYEEMQKTMHEMQDGIGEIRAYERFGIRCGQQPYRKLSSILMQNVRKGTKGMQKQLDAEAEEAFTQRKQRAMQLGEEAGTKLLLPMGLMLVLVFLILLVPAGLSLSL